MRDPGGLRSSGDIVPISPDSSFVCPASRYNLSIHCVSGADLDEENDQHVVLDLVQDSVLQSGIRALLPSVLRTFANADSCWNDFRCPSHAGGVPARNPSSSSPHFEKLTAQISPSHVGRGRTGASRFGSIRLPRVRTNRS